MTESAPVSRNDYPASIADDPDLEWEFIDESAAVPGGAGFVGELPLELWEDTDWFASEHGLEEVHHDQGPFGTGTESVVDFGAGYFYRFDDGAENHEEMLLRPMPSSELAEWLRTEGPLSRLTRQVQRWFDEVFEDFEPALADESDAGELVATLRDRDGDFVATVQHLPDGSALIEARHLGSPEFRRQFPSLWAARKVADRQLWQLFGNCAVEPSYRDMWESWS